MPNSLAIDDSFDVDSLNLVTRKKFLVRLQVDKTLHMTIAQEAFERNKTYSGEQSQNILIERLSFD